MKSLETDTIALPLAGKTPAEELEALKLCAGILNREIIIGFTGRNGGSTITVDLGEGPEASVDPEIAERATRIAPFLIECDIYDWNLRYGSEGFVRISSNDAPWIDAVDHNEDWLLERYIDTDALEDRSFDEDEQSIEIGV